MGHLHGRLCNFWRSVQQLCAGTGRQSNHSGGYLCSGVPAASGTIDIRHHPASRKNSTRAAQSSQDPQYRIADSGAVLGKTMIAGSFSHFDWKFSWIVEEKRMHSDLLKSVSRV